MLLFGVNIYNVRNATPISNGFDLINISEYFSLKKIFFFPDLRSSFFPVSSCSLF